MNAKSGTTISFHQERLLNRKQREEMKQHWNIVMKELSESIKCAAN
jgi:hypothetical protein